LSGPARAPARRGGIGPGFAAGARRACRVNDYDLKAAHAQGEHVWHVHERTDEFFLVIDGRFDIELRSADGSERRVEPRAGDVFVVPKGIEHKPSSPGGAILMFELAPPGPRTPRPRAPPRRESSASASS
jgi:mannose-6-phosphate isomerase-like protein (cupin superfamily)